MRRGLATLAVLTVLAVVCATACGTFTQPAQQPQVGALEARYRAARAQPPQVAATAIYRGLLGRSLYARCRMWPSDSVAFDAHARRCGALRAAFLAASRLLLEREARARFLAPVSLDGYLRWMDLPTSCAR